VVAAVTRNIKISLFFRHRMALTNMQLYELNHETTTRAASNDGSTRSLCGGGGGGGGGGSIDDDQHPQRRAVSLSSVVKVVTINSALSDEQIKTMWYTREELQSLTKSRNAIRDHSGRCDQKRVPRPDGATEDSAICTDGLKTSTGSAFAGTVVRYAVHTVLNEQESQWEQDIDDPVHIALIYSECCSLSQWEALETATRLAKEVQQLLQPPRSSTTTTTTGGGKLRKPTSLYRSMTDATSGKYSPEAAKKSSVKKITSMPSLKISSSKNKLTSHAPRSKKLSMNNLSNMSALLHPQQEASSSSKNKSFQYAETKKISMHKIRSLLSLKEESSSSSSFSKRKLSCDSESQKNPAIPKIKSLPSLDNKESSSSFSSSKHYKSPSTKTKTLQLERRKSATGKLFNRFL
jgi:hypothetical protein